MNTLRRQIISRSLHSKMVKLNEVSRNLDSQIQRDQDEFRRKIFHAGNFSEVQKCVKSICRGTQLVFELYLEDTEATTDVEKADLFNSLLQSFFTKSIYQRKIDKKKLVRIEQMHFSKTEIETALQALNNLKAKGPDRIGSLPLKRPATCLSS